MKESIVGILLVVDLIVEVDVDVVDETVGIATSNSKILLVTLDDLMVHEDELSFNTLTSLATLSIRLSRLFNLPLADSKSRLAVE